MILSLFCIQALVVNGLVTHTVITVLLFVNKNVLVEYIKNNPLTRDLNLLINADSKDKLNFLHCKLTNLFVLALKYWER